MKKNDWEKQVRQESLEAIESHRQKLIKAYRKSSKKKHGKLVVVDKKYLTLLANLQVLDSFKTCIKRNKKEGLKMIELQRKEIFKAVCRGLEKRMRENPELRITLRSLTKMLRQDQKEC